VGLILRANLIFGIVIGLKWGIVGVAAGYAIASFLNIYPNVYFAGRLINLKFLDLVKSLSGIFLCSVGMALIVYVIGLVLPNDWSSTMFLVIQTISGISIYLILINLFHLKAYEDTRKIIIDQLKPLFLRYKKLNQPNG
jgi:PST family polysaccharide transporter